jgi:hypothetical protein
MSFLQRRTQAICRVRERAACRTIAARRYGEFSDETRRCWLDRVEPRFVFACGGPATDVDHGLHPGPHRIGKWVWGFHDRPNTDSQRLFCLGCEPAYLTKEQTMNILQPESEFRLLRAGLFRNPRASPFGPFHSPGLCILSAMDHCAKAISEGFGPSSVEGWLNPSGVNEG